MTDEPSVKRVADDAETRYQTLISHVRDAIVEFEFVDGKPLVCHVNDAFVDVFGYESAKLEGESLDDRIVPDWNRAEATRLNERTAAGEVNYQQVRRETADGLRTFLYRGVPYGDEAIAADGMAIYTDLTEITRQKRQLQVMNRVLRHNLRNAVNVITGNMTRLLNALDDQTSEQVDAAAKVEHAAHELETLTQEAIDIESVITAESVDTVIDCVPLIQRVVTDYRQRYPSAEIRMTLPDSMLVSADSRLRRAIESLVTNAIEHNPAATPYVHVQVTDNGPNGWVEIYVDDDGPQIPADERTVIRGDANIEPTHHGSGLGLWLVKWTVELYGGELSFETSSLGGNSVRLRLLRGDHDAME
ncbi:PAS domain S-box-containing protein [Haloplanus vescus]|uniref:histidine kinase n=1 Tax=Haloplanus vescus TaxID=555874 RepID=A0A1H3X831_9EURY|nr:PAS domain-containing sensor histidine kinase [Haloplanus vescus]SDZ95557.1 PAS domain S-box-containing protein [Haloplanus vescus]